MQTGAGRKKRGIPDHRELLEAMSEKTTSQAAQQQQRDGGSWASELRR
jgi:hypothetical protein